MTTISRKITVRSDAKTLWEFMNMRRWSEFSTLFTKIDYPNSSMQVGDEAKITAGPGTEKVNYTARITVLDPGKRLEYLRTGGPLPGKSAWEISPNPGSCEINYSNTFEHELPDPVKKSMGNAMERFLADLKLAVENRSNGRP